jgi:plasmid stability protein
MALNLSIKGVPEALAAQLRARAERNHRSLQGELMAIIERAAREPAGTEPGSSESERVAAALRRLGAISRGTKTIEQIAAEHRDKYPEPISGVPLAVDIVREDRDTR